MHNKAFWRALHSFAHPLSIAAVLLVLLNDHVLRIHWPSWCTGKIGDFAWLIFAPFVCAMLFSWFIPQRFSSHEKLTGVIACIFIGLWFAAAKTLPLIQAITNGTLGYLVGWEGALRLDSTDLFTLPALLISWHIWQKAGNKPIELAPYSWIFLGLGIVGTLATSQPPSDFGIVHLRRNDDVIIAAGNFRLFTSEDGGLTWQELSLPLVQQPLFTFTALDHNQFFDLRDPTDESILYRFRPGAAIDRSENNGEDWELFFDLSEVNREVRIAYHHQNEEIAYPARVKAGPHDALIDTHTGNLIVAMGHEGVLLRLSSGEWRWVKVGPYYYESLNHLDGMLSILSTEIWLALLLGLLLFRRLCNLMSNQESSLIKNAAITVAQILWVFTVLFLTQNTYLDSAWIFDFSSLGHVTILISGFIAFALAWDNATIVILEAAYLLKPALISAVVAIILFLFPYVLWTQGTIAQYNAAKLFALLLTVVAVVAGSWYVTMNPKMKRKKNKEIPLEE